MTRLFVRIRQFIRELRRRRVLRVAAVYGGTAFVVLRLASILVEPFQLPGWTVRLVTLLLLLGFPLAVGLAWVYNVTERGLVPIEETAEEAGSARGHGKPFTSNGVVIGLLILIAGLLIYPRITGAPSSSSSGAAAEEREGAADTSFARLGEKSVAVLPFTYLAGEDSTDYLSLGMTDELLTRLAQFESLSVIGRTSVMRYEGTDKSVPEIGKELGVAHIVEGSVLRIEDQIRVQAQLLDARTGEHEWADSYTRPMENILRLQSDLAQEVAGNLRANLLSAETRQVRTERPVDSSAYALYLQARRLRFRETASSLLEATRKLERSLRMDSTYAPAWSLLSFCGLFVPIRGGTLPQTVLGIPSDSLPRVAARRALELDSASAEAQLAMGLVKETLEYDFAAAGPYLKRAVEIGPGRANVQREYGLYLMRMGRFELAEPYMRDAVRLDPASSVAHRTLGRNLLYQGRYEEAKRRFEQAHDLNPEMVFYHEMMWRAYAAQDSARSARSRYAGEIRNHRDTWLLAKLWAYSKEGRRDSARVLASRMAQRADEIGPGWRAILAPQRGRIDVALKYVPDITTPYIKISPYYRPLREEPAFQDRLRELGLDEESVRTTLRKLGETPV